MESQVEFPLPPSEKIIPLYFQAFYPQKCDCIFKGLLARLPVEMTRH